MRRSLRHHLNLPVLSPLNESTWPEGICSHLVKTFWLLLDTRISHFPKGEGKNNLTAPFIYHLVPRFAVVLPGLC